MRAVAGNWKSFGSWLIVTVVVMVSVSWLVNSAGFASTSKTLWPIVATSAATATARMASPIGPSAPWITSWVIARLSSPASM